MDEGSFDVWNERGLFIARLWDNDPFQGHSAQKIKRLFESHVESGGHPDVVIDWNHQEIWNNLILSAILRLLKLVRAHQGRIVLCNVHEHAIETLRITDLDRLFLFRENLVAAIALLKEVQNSSETDVFDA